MRRTSASDHSLTCLKAYWLPRQSRGLIEELDLLWWEEFTGRALCLLATIAPPFDPLKSRDSEEHIGIWSSEGVEAIWLWHQRGFGGDNSISNARWPRNVLLKKEEQRSSLTLRVILPWVGSRGVMNQVGSYFQQSVYKIWTNLSLASWLLARARCDDTCCYKS